MKTLEFTIYQEPKGKGTVQHTKAGIAYHTAAQKTKENALMTEMLPHRPDEIITDPVELVVICHFPIPKSRTKKWKAEAEDGRMPHTKKPDADNICKQVGDCLQALQFIKNDSQIYRLHISKYYGVRAAMIIKLLY